MKQILITFYIAFTCITLKAQPAYFNWAKQAGGVGEDVGFSIAIDNFGNTYSTGKFEGTVDFDPGVGVVNLTSKGGSDIFITKLDANGNFIWVKQLGGNLDDIGTSITTDNSGNLFLTGLFRDQVDFDPNSAVTNLTSKGGDDIFILKLTLSGNFILIKQIGGIGTQESQDITIDKYGNIYTTGQFTNTTDFDPGLDSFTYTSQFRNGFFVSKLDSLGKFLWAKKFESFSWNQSVSITTDLFGNVIFTGNFGGEIDFNPGLGIYKLITLSDNHFDMFICKLNSTGEFVWAGQIGGSISSIGTSVVTDKFSNVFITGSFMGQVDFDPSIGKANYLNTKSQAYGAFISKLDSLGNFVWAKQLGGNNETMGSSLKIDDLGNIYSSGQFIGKEDFDPGAGIFNLQSNGYDAYLSKLDPKGNFIWAKNFGGFTQIGINDFVLDEFGNIYSTGYFNEESDFDPDSASFNLTSNGSLDIFIHKLGKNSLIIKEVNNENSSKIYPNPNNGLLKLSFEKSLKNGKFKIFNCLGQIVFSQNISESNFEIDISDQPNGIYFIEIGDDENILRVKLIKN